MSGKTINKTRSPGGAGKSAIFCLGSSLSVQSLPLPNRGWPSSLGILTRSIEVTNRTSRAEVGQAMQIASIHSVLHAGVKGSI